jgi:hypothetical protein
VTQLHVPARLHLHPFPHPRLADLWATRPLLALWGGLAVLDVGRVLRAAPLVEVAAIAALVAACSYGVNRLLAVGVAAIGWLLLNGFVVHASGELGFVGLGDVVRAVALLAVALAATAVRR